MATFLITGANRGIGAALTESALSAGHKVIATSRDLGKMPDFKHNDQLTLLPLELTSDDSINQFAKTLIKKKIEIDYLINNAGISLNNHFFAATKDELEYSLRVNLIAPFLLTQKVFQVLSKQAKIVQLSSGAASLTNTHQFKGTPLDTYAISKSALNMFTLRLSLQVSSEQAVVAISPGWVKTDMGGDQAPDTPEYVAAKLLDTLLNIGPEDNGTFIDFAKKPIDW
ncbi:SDR family NAD(P)-dependent oxidoreductase [Gayadomonas joobiniege]|uniref:SDR family NAD(P)-dependent oxidoreductase n=1 Tax=Gayadomonas joobiniege TaxID=1234606 RepID=UPI00037129D0|nr:SDR family NAD(P)-dependent oxidoreductase [Gayadomonas joobiniege]